MRTLLGRGMKTAVGLVTLAASALCSAQTPAEPALQLGVLPNVSARVILQNYRPVRALLERELGRTVEVSTAPDFKNFHARTLAGEYDLVVTAANLARLAMQDADYIALAIYEPPIPAVLVTAKAQPVKSVAELKGKKLALANPQSLVALRGLRWLGEQGLRVGSDFHTTHARNDDSLGQLLTSGEAPLALLSMGEFRQIAEPTRSLLQVFDTIARVPGFMVLANPRQGAAAGRFKSLLLGLPAQPEGKEFLQVSGVQGLREPTEADLQAVDPYLEETRALLGAER